MNLKSQSEYVVVVVDDVFLSFRQRPTFKFLLILEESTSNFISNADTSARDEWA